MPEANQTNHKESRDGLALILGGIFILGLVFATYTYFNKSSDVQNTELSSEETSILDKLKNIISSNTVREEGEQGEEGKEEQGETKETAEEGQAQEKDEVSKTPGKNGSISDLGTGGPTNGTNGNVTNEVTEKTAFSELAWTPNDYIQGDISGYSYTVKSGDTLWEISEGVYGSGFEWTKILDANKEAVGFLPNGSQALIVPGQVLSLPAP